MKRIRREIRNKLRKCEVYKKRKYEDKVKENKW